MYIKIDSLIYTNTHYNNPCIKYNNKIVNKITIIVIKTIMIIVLIVAIVINILLVRILKIARIRKFLSKNSNQILKRS